MAHTEIPSYRRVTQDQQQTQGEPLLGRFGKKELYLGGVSFLLSRAAMLGKMSPFGVAFFAASFDKQRFWVTFLGVIIGFLSVGAGIQTCKYAIAMGLFALYKFLLDRAGEHKPLTNAVCAATSLFVGGFCVMLFQTLLMYDILLLLLESLICGFLNIVLREGTAVLASGAQKKYITNEQLISLVILFGLSLAGIQDFTKFGPVSLSEIICSICIMVFAYQRGPTIGACVGLASGLICAMNSFDILPVIGIYTLCGFAAGLARPLGRFGVGIVFLLCGAAMGFCTTLFVLGSVSIYNFVLACGIFLFLPKRVLLQVEKVFSGSFPDDSDYTYINRLQSLMTGKLRAVSHTFSSLSDSFEALSQKRLADSAVSQNRIFDDAADKICKSCGLCSMCWEKEFETTWQAMQKVGKKLEEKGYADVLDVPEYFRKKCVRIDDLLATINHYYDINRINTLWSSQLDESRKLLSQQYKGFAGIMETLSEEMQKDMIFEGRYENRIKSALLKRHIRTKGVCLFERTNGCLEVEVELERKQDLEYEGDILLAVSEILNQPMRIADRTSEEECTLFFEAQYHFRVSSGVATIKKDGQEKNGDSYRAINLPDNRYALVISDGMGSGDEAANESMTAVSLLEKLLKAGFDKAAAVRLINSALVLKSDKESFATIDLSMIDLMNGRIEFVKIGAAASYIKRHKKNEIETIRCSSLPAGILNELDMQTTAKRLTDGDIVVLVSDGVADIKKGSNWIGELLLSIDSDEPDVIAEIIIKEAVIYNHGTVHDDMTVMVAKIWEIE